MAGALHFVAAMWKPTVALLIAAGCQIDLERPATLAELGPLTLDFYIGSYVMWLDVEYTPYTHEPCPVLGDDFAAHIGDLPLSTYPGGAEDDCADIPCTRTEPTCHVPHIGLNEIAHQANAVLVFGDASRTIECKLGDSLVERGVTRVPDGSWEVSPGESMTVQWSPGGDLAHYKLAVSFVEWKRNTVSVSHTTDRNRITFAVPSSIHPGYQMVRIAVSGDVATMLKGCTVPDHRSYTYVVEQWVHVM